MASASFFLEGRYVEKTKYKVYNGIRYKIIILDIGEYVFWRVSHGETLTSEIREQMRKDFGYHNFTALDFGVDKGYGLWEIKRIK